MPKTTSHPPTYNPLRHSRLIAAPLRPFHDRQGYLDGPLSLRVAEREHERLRTEFRHGHVDRHNQCHLVNCDDCRSLLVEAQKGQPAYQHRDNTFADPTTSFDFETEDLDPTWNMNYINQLRWDDMPDVGAPTTEEMCRLRGLRWDVTMRPARIWVSAYRDDDTWFPRAGGNAIFLVCVPLDQWYSDVVDEDGNPVKDRRGQAQQVFHEQTWRWCVVQCEEVEHMLSTPNDLRRFMRLTGLKAKAQKRYKRRVMTPVEKLARNYLDYEEARDDARRWYAECEDLDDAFYRERPIFDPEVLYNARIEAFDGAAYPQIRGAVRAVRHDEDWD